MGLGPKTPGWGSPTNSQPKPETPGWGGGGRPPVKADRPQQRGTARQASIGKALSCSV